MINPAELKRLLEVPSDEEELRCAVNASSASNVPAELWRLLQSNTPSLDSEEDRIIWLNTFGTNPPDEVVMTMGILYSMSMSIAKDYALAKGMYSRLVDLVMLTPRSAVELHGVQGLVSCRTSLMDIRQATLDSWTKLDEIEKYPQAQKPRMEQIVVWQGLQVAKGLVEVHFQDPINHLRVNGIMPALARTLPITQVTNKRFN